MDLGAGDGAFVVGTATARPDVLVVGVDAHGLSMAPAGRTIQRRRLTNALLVAARAEELPPELHGLAAAVRVHFPWGSLLSGLVGGQDVGRDGGQDGVVAGLARIARPGGTVTAVLSVSERERGLGLPVLDALLAPGLAARCARQGLTLTEWRPATEAELAETRSSWAKRLGAGARREAWVLRLVRAG